MQFSRLAKRLALRTLRRYRLPWPQSVLGEVDDTILLAHAEALTCGPAGRVLLAGTPDEVRYAQAALKRHGIRPTSLAVCVTSGDPSPRNGLPYLTVEEAVKREDLRGAIIVARGWDEVMGLHKVLSPLKRKGLPVVTAYGCRVPTAEAAWQWTNVGISRVGMFQLAARYLQCLRDRGGDYLEFGCFDGQSIALAYHTIGSKNAQARFFGFDSFEGIRGSLPEEQYIFQDGDYFANQESFWQNLRAAQVDTHRVVAVPGDFATSLAEPARLRAAHGLKACICAHIDCDVYQPAKMALNFLADILVDGALLLFDEYDDMGSSAERGEKRAVREWLQEHPEFELEEYRRYEFACRAFLFGRKR